MVVAAACSSSGHPGAATTTTAPATTSPASTTPATTSPGGGTSSTATAVTRPSAPSTTSVSTANGVVTITGSGGLIVPIPSSVPLPAIVHASYGGKQSFVVSGIGQVAGHEPVLASSFGAYDGVFPVGFVDPAGDPTVALHVATRGAWQLYIGSAATHAPSLGSGQAGVGDTVLAYTGPAATAHLTYAGRKTLIVNMYENGGLIPLVHTKGPYNGPISLVTGPAFIQVTTVGTWSIKIG